MGNNPKLKFRLLSISELSSYLNSTTSLNIDKFSSSKVLFIRSFRLNFNEVLGVLDIIIKIDFHYKVEKGGPLKLFGLETSTKIGFKDFQGIIPQNDDKTLNMPIALLHNLVSIAYSSTRGMLVCIASKTDYEKILLPLITPEEIEKMLSQTPK